MHIAAALIMVGVSQLRSGKAGYRSGRTAMDHIQVRRGIRTVNGGCMSVSSRFSTATGRVRTVTGWVTTIRGRVRTGRGRVRTIKNRFTTVNGRVRMGRVGLGRLWVGTGVLRSV